MRRALLTALLLVATPAFARAPEPIREAKAALREEQREYREIDRISERWERAALHERERAMARQDRRLEAWIDRELQENKRDRAHARSGLARAGGDVAAEREAVRAGVAGPNTPDRAREARASFRRSHADVLDVRELRWEIDALAPVFEHGAATPDLIDRKLARIEDLRALQAADVQRAKNTVARAERRFGG